MSYGTFDGRDPPSDHPTNPTQPHRPTTPGATKRWWRSQVDADVVADAHGGDADLQPDSPGGSPQKGMAMSASWAGGGVGVDVDQPSGGDANAGAVRGYSVVAPPSAPPSVLKPGDERADVQAMDPGARARAAIERRNRQSWGGVGGADAGGVDQVGDGAL